MTRCIATMNDVLDQVHEHFLQGDVAAPMSVLLEELRAACLQAPREEWLKDTVPACRRHPLHALLLQDPLTRRAFEKPRGYAGDAVMLDYVYTGVAPAGTTDLGRAVLGVVAAAPGGRSVVGRRGLLAELIDAAARAEGGPAILSLGCGHLREAQRARSARLGWGGRFHALDQDGESLAVVQHEQGQRGVRTVCASVGSLLRGRPGLEGLHLVYAAGLFDYLDDALAARLLGAMYEMLRPGGRLLVANFAPDSHARGYMEAMMDWWLVYRTEGQLEALASAVANPASMNYSVVRDAEGNIVYLQMTRIA
jgi:hypothetical protein